MEVERILTIYRLEMNGQVDIGLISKDEFESLNEEVKADEGSTLAALGQVTVSYAEECQGREDVKTMGRWLENFTLSDGTPDFK